MADCDLKPQITRKPSRNITLWNKADWGKIRDQTNGFTATFLNECSSRSVDENYHVFSTFITDITTHQIPSKMSSSRNHLPWYNRYLRRIGKIRDRRRKRAVKSGNNLHWEQYLVEQKKVKQAQDKAHWDYVNNILQTSLDENNPKPFWKYIKSKRNESFGIPSLENNNMMYSDSRSKSEILNSQFKSVFTTKKL